MGCAFGKSSTLEDSSESTKGRQVSKLASSVLHRVRNSGKREESFRVKDRKGTGELKVSYVDKRSNSSRRVCDEEVDKKTVKSSQVVVDGFPVIRGIPSAIEGEQVAAGWPSWLAGVAGESIKGWIPRRADTFEKLDKVCFSDVVTLWSTFYLVCS